MKLTIPKRRYKHFDLTPMIDIVFNILLFFILTYQISRYSEININLPESQTRNSTSNGIELTITKNYELYFNGKKTEIDKLKKLVLNIDKNTTIVLKSDKNVELGYIVKILDIFSTSGFKNVNVLTKSLE
ncbi:MAG: biopolymer transporter ExbD [Elusimicrobiales bacterium]|nr:biopolymer transporter ExbD [Elusimicrobiales bacterium]